MPRVPSDVPATFVNHPDHLADLGAALQDSIHLAIDTETPTSGPMAHRMRVMSVATRDQAGNERSFVVDVRDLDATLLAPLLTGRTADAWNADFDAKVVDRAVWQSADTTPGLRWWDAQLADALLHQGRSGVTWYHGLAWATEHYLGLKAEGKGTVQLSYTAEDDLTADQIAYAAADAVETLWVSDAIRAAVAEAGLHEVTDIEMQARPFLDQMERTGLPFDWSGWQNKLAHIEERNRAVIGELAMLTGGGQGTLFDDVIEPSWNPGSDMQVRDALNRWAEPQVRAWMASRHGADRLLTDTDSVNATVLREIGGELCSALLEYRNHTKILSTYGESIHDHLHEDGRLRPQYLQVVGTNTGRLASRNPNAQNFTPLMKPYVRPALADRVFVHADLSQAELRFLAEVANDEPLRAAFAAGVDVHISTAASMFNVDPVALEREDPSRLKHLRQIAKALNFGIAYGTGAAALSRSLTAEGSPTTLEEAKELLAQYRRTYPGTAAWAEERIAEIAEIKKDTVAIDWHGSMRLARGFPEVRSLRRQLRQSLNRWPTAEEIVEQQPDLDVGEVSWLLGYSAPVALLANGEPFTFASRTLSGRRQQFNLHLDRLFLGVVTDAVRSDSPVLVAIRDNFARTHDLTLTAPGRPISDGEVARNFEERHLRRMFVEAIAHEAGEEVAESLLGRSARERVSAMVNAWRNAPIQGGVADIMLVAYGYLDDGLRQFPTARPVQTVHDSVVVECDQADAENVAIEVQEALERASLRFCPNVTPKADVDVRRSLADADVIAS